MKKVVDFLSEVKAELIKVTWPKRKEVIRLTLVVIGISAIVAAFVGSLDLIFTKLLETVVK
ncbi:MAG: preprotein translocase subunit SecE [bacterium]